MAKSLTEEYDIWRLRNDVMVEYSEYVDYDCDGIYYVGNFLDGNMLDISNDEHVLILAELLGLNLEKYRFDDYNQKSE